MELLKSKKQEPNAAIELACALTLEKGFDLELVYEHGDLQCYIEWIVKKA